MILIQGKSPKCNINRFLSILSNFASKEYVINTLYINGTIPDKLHYYVCESPIAENVELMKRFNYERFSDLQSLKEYFVQLEIATGVRTLIVIEGFQQIINNTTMLYTDKNALICDVLDILRKRKIEPNKKAEVYILDEFNYFVLLYCDVVLEPFE